LPPADSADSHGVVGIGADLEPGTLLAAYRHGLFPMPLRRRSPVAWWSPDPRGVIPLDGLRITRSLRRSRRRYETTVDAAFAEVIAACADPARPHGWITGEIVTAYTRLHELGWAHSIEVWQRDGGELGEARLVGGLYGVAIAGLFAGESMFSRATDASKVALAALADILRDDGRLERLLDVQWTTPHLASLGAEDLPRAAYLRRLRAALEVPLPTAFEVPA
jgi:leucyl/phenylalanyl-tRNA--protein transferase